MKHLQFFPFTIILMLSFMNFSATNAQTTIALDDFKILNNTSWEGTLTYLDYQSGEPVPVSTTMQMKITDKAIETDIQYTYEPNKNVHAITKIRKKGTYLGKQKVISKSINEVGSVILITSAVGKDDNKKATMFYTYEYDNDMYKVTKEVQFEGSSQRFMRNSYHYTKL